MIILGICGQKSSGKDSFADIAKKILQSDKVMKLSFAKPLKDFVINLFNLQSKYAWGSEADKNYPIATWGKYFTQDALDKYKKENDTLLSTREILQVVGTDVMRLGNFNFLVEDLRSKVKSFIMKHFNKEVAHDTIWIDLLKKDIEDLNARGIADIFIISDVRFANEVNSVKSWGGKVVRLYRDTNLTNSIPHPSELEMNNILDKEFDYVLYEEDNVNLKQLRKFVLRVLMEEKLVNSIGYSI